MRPRGLCELTLESRDHRALAHFYRVRWNCRCWPRRRTACGSPAAHTADSVSGRSGSKAYGDRGGRHVHFAFSVAHGRLHEIARRLRNLGVCPRGPVEHEGGDHSLYFEDPAGNLVEAWDFFEDGDGARDGVAALS